MSEEYNLPEDLYYWPEKHLWVRPEPDGTAVVGLSEVAQRLVGNILMVNLRAPGKVLLRGKSAGTLETGKWVGAVPAPVAGEVVEVNAELEKRPSLVNSDPYGEGWLIRVRPAAWEAEASALVTGPDGLAQYRESLRKDGLLGDEA